MRNIIVPTGFMGSGSSAMTDLLSEFSNMNTKNADFEYVFLHMPNGVFDLEDKLLVGNNALRSDEALHTFLETMQQLYDKKYWWVGNYKNKVGADFLQATINYIHDLTQYEPNFYWYWQENTNKKMMLQLIKNKVLKAITLGKIKLKKPLTYPTMWMSYVSPEEFYAASKTFIQCFFDMFDDEHNIVLDQLVLPYNLHRLHHYFDEQLYTYVIDRDPRDVFLINKYIWSKQNMSVPFPTDVEAFCHYYKSIRLLVKDAIHPNVDYIHFEDLVYKYDETLNKIKAQLHLSDEQHLYQFQKFDPKKSIQNTQLFLMNETYRNEGLQIYKELKKYCYEFPYEINDIDRTIF